MRPMDEVPKTIKPNLQSKFRKKRARGKPLVLKLRVSELSKEEKDRLLFEVFDILLYENKNEGSK